ncbi:uncharacterized protein LOC121054518 [Oryza brachyantha]|uniref:uncharacterized protein LOC121054518 n=1 Tax=Oryza brachyantha TaxID=4533 RepID=UPI001ADAA447|nr:uncharacterized protein LOC121054518 [Oryza brachyantha]
MVASSSITCCHLTPAPAPAAATSRGGGGGGGVRAARLQQLRRACLAAAAACAVLGTAAGEGGASPAVMLRPDQARETATATAVGPARWSDRRQCPPWRANSLENIVPENLPRPSARRRFNSITAAESAPAPASPDAVLPFLALRSGMSCFSL